MAAAQESYLEWLSHTGVNAGEVEACDDCSSEEIQLPVNVPFGNYYHNSVYVSEPYSLFINYITHSRDTGKLYVEFSYVQWNIIVSYVYLHHFPTLSLMVYTYAVTILH